MIYNMFFKSLIYFIWASIFVLDDALDIAETRQQVAEGGHRPPYTCHLEDPQEAILKIALR